MIVTVRTCIQADRWVEGQAGRQAGRHAGRQAGRLAGRKAGKQTDTHTYRHTDIQTLSSRFVKPPTFPVANMRCVRQDASASQIRVLSLPERNPQNIANDFVICRKYN